MTEQSMTTAEALAGYTTALGDRHEVAADTLELGDDDLARIGAHLRVCSGSSALPPRAQVFYSQLADGIGSVLHMRRQDMREVERLLGLSSSWAAAVVELLEDDVEREGEQP